MESPLQWNQTMRLFDASARRTRFSMLLCLILAVGVSDAHPEQLLFRPTPKYLRGRIKGKKPKTRTN